MARFELNREEVAAKVVDGDAVLINLSTGVYYSLQGSGSRAWAMLEAGHTADEVAGELVRRHGADADQAAADVAALIDQLVAENVLRARANDAPDTVDEAQLPADGAYEPPTLERYDDMGDLLALDPPMPGVASIPWRAPDA